MRLLDKQSTHETSVTMQTAIRAGHNKQSPIPARSMHICNHSNLELPRQHWMTLVPAGRGFPSSEQCFPPAWYPCRGVCC